MRVSKRSVTEVIQLLSENPWLLERCDALTGLQEECATEEEFSLVIDLLRRYSYITDDDLEIGFQAITTQICDIWKLDPQRTFICPPKVDSSADSGPAVVQTIKTILGRKRIRGFELSIRLTKLKDFCKNRDTIVLVDDFAGTGSTIKSKIDQIKKYYPNSTPSIFVCLIASAEAARESLRDRLTDFFSWKEFSRGISDHYPLVDAESNIKIMKAMEARLNPAIGKTPLPSLGYGGTEVLMGWEPNLPNSVFPIFWWPELAAGESRNTLFHRNISDQT